jgi:glycosyltransferase involved in cell wall biosynthesis
MRKHYISAPSERETKMLENMPLVSICIPTYLGAKFIEKTLISVLTQNYSNLEVIISDDNSPDGTEEIIKRQIDTRIKYFKNQTNLGAQENWNACLMRANGIYFKLLPHDDTLEMNCIANQVAILEADQSKKIALVFGKRKVIDSSGKLLFTRGLAYKTQTTLKSQDLIQLCVRSGSNRIGEPGNGLVRTELARIVGGYDAEFPYLIDLDYWFRVLAHGDAVYTPAHSSSFRIVEASWSVSLGGKQFADFNKFIIKFKKSPGYQITTIDKIIGYANSGITTMCRLIIYKYLFR